MKIKSSKTIIKQRILVFFTSLIFFVIETANSCENAIGFRIFDATLYTDKPNLTIYGIQPLPSIDNFWRPKPPGDKAPTHSMIMKAIKKLKTRKYSDAFIDIEHWPIRGDDANKVNESITKYKYVINAVKKELPNTRIGLYGMMPIRDYWRAIKPKNSKEYIEWRKENDKLSKLVSKVDFLLPSLYTFYDDQASWEKYAIANLSEAQRISQGKPVYAFLWPQYHDSNRVLKGKNIPRKYFRKQLEIVQMYSDGVVFWGGWHNGRMKWDKNMGWWQETLSWLNCVNSKISLYNLVDKFQYQ